MSKLILSLDTETGHIDYKYPEHVDVPQVTVNATMEGHLKGVGENQERVITGWSISVRVGELPEERERQRLIGRLLKWSDKQKEALRKEVDDDGMSTLDIGLRCRLEGAIELSEALLEEMGYQEEPPQQESPQQEPPQQAISAGAKRKGRCRRC